MSDLGDKMRGIRQRAIESGTLVPEEASLSSNLRSLIARVNGALTDKRRTTVTLSREEWQALTERCACGHLTLEHSDNGRCTVCGCTIRAALPDETNGDTHAFKNFHRALCERFDYCHDEKDWRRDQVSLIEWIAKRQRYPAPYDPEKDGALLGYATTAQLIAELAARARFGGYDGYRTVDGGSSALKTGAEP